MYKILEFDEHTYKASVLTRFCSDLCDNRQAFKIGAEMVKLMLEHGGIGLAANQIGLTIPLISLLINQKPVILYRPTIVYLGKENSIGEEGCLSLPGYKVEISRPTLVKFSAIVNKLGRRKEFTLKGLEARCFLHEYFHLQGKTILCDRGNL